jgi:hypothetical protein
MISTIRVPIKLTYNNGPWLTVAVDGSQTSLELLKTLHKHSRPISLPSPLMPWADYQLSGMDEVGVMVYLIRGGDEYWLAIHHGKDFAMVLFKDIGSVSARLVLTAWAKYQFGRATNQTLIADERRVLQETCEKLRTHIEILRTDL